MKLAQFYSHLNGLEFLLVHKPTLWQEIQAVITGIDAEACKIERSEGQLLYSPAALNTRFSELLQACGWHESRVSYWNTSSERLVRKTLALPPDLQKSEIEAANEVPIFSYNQTDFVKDRVAVEVQLGKYAFVAYDLFVKHLAFYVGDHIDVGIEILPMKALQARMSSGIGYYEGEIYNVVRQGRGVPAVPLVVIGIEP